MKQLLKRRLRLDTTTIRQLVPLSRDEIKNVAGGIRPTITEPTHKISECVSCDD